MSFLAFSFSFGSKRAINLVFYDHCIRFVELKSAEPPVASRWGERFLPAGIIEDGKIVDFETLSTILEECVDEWKIQRRHVNFIVPDPLVIIRKISISADVLEDEVKSHLYMELGASIHLPFEDPVFDVYPLGEKNGKQELLLFASPEKFVMEYSELLSKVKLVPSAADISPLALYRLYYSMDEAQREEGLFTVQINLTGVSMCIFEEHIPYFMRQFPLDFDVEKWEVKRDRTGFCEYSYSGDQLQLEGQFSTVFTEMAKLMDFYRYSSGHENAEITKILLDGDHPKRSMILEEMKMQFNVPITILPSEAVHNGRNRILPESYALALGLGLKEVK
ncbi:pilus assembly protein PilM [Neobacillus notoginsengisoli]|uniref:Pilus assembly protein PilM n=1 Tax=Neobacillus notoginsengisoli TaxID=1578198 RepID=A0A417YU00_9BACI|nr:pilus assembly protein PilM [Neobacillus notoginsengisoli]RHW40640.1 pilus assembly protein PilM [Neobacillus notoginsengisoli]